MCLLHENVERSTFSCKNKTKCNKNGVYSNKTAYTKQSACLDKNSSKKIECSTDEKTVDARLKKENADLLEKPTKWRK